MKLAIFCVLLITACGAQQQHQRPQQQKQRDESAVQRTPRAPQGHVQYSDPSGSKVDWRIYAPYSQWKSYLEAPQRDARTDNYAAQQGSSPRAASIEPAAAKREEQQVQPAQIQYQPFAMVPAHIKQMLQRMYEPQQPYVDPAVFVYNQQQKQKQSQREEKSFDEERTAQASAQSQFSTGLYEYIPKFHTKYIKGMPKVGYIKYKDDHPAASDAFDSPPRYGSIPEDSRQEPIVEADRQRQSIQQDDGTPTAIHQLLNLQAQMPHHVIADGIVYKPKSIFVPKHLVNYNGKGPYKYRSKVYYYKNDKYEPESKESSEKDESREQDGEE